MKKWLKITLMSVLVISAGVVTWYFIDKANKRKKAYKTSVTPPLASDVINYVNANDI